MTTFEPTAPVPDDERLSRYLDGDLDPTEVAALRRDLAADAALRGRLDVLARVVDHVGSLHADAGAEAEAEGIDFGALRDRALAAWAGEAPGSPAFAAVEPAAEPAANRGHLAAVAVTPARRRWRARPPLAGLSAAAALALVAGLALLIDRGSSDDQADQAASVAAPATSTYSPQRATASAAAEAAAEAESSRPALGGGEQRSSAATAAAMADAGSGPGLDTTQPGSPSPAPEAAPLGDFATYHALLDAVRAQPIATATTSRSTDASSPPGPAPASTTTAAMGGTTATVACAATHPGSATVDGLAVRWAVQGDGSSGSPATIEVVDAATCAVVARQAR